MLILEKKHSLIYCLQKATTSAVCNTLVKQATQFVIFQKYCRKCLKVNEYNRTWILLYFYFKSQ